MHYTGLESMDLGNVKTLNDAWLATLRQSPPASTHAAPAGVEERLARLPAESAERLAASPFLLFDLGIADERWQAASISGTPDLLDALDSQRIGMATLAGSAAGFLWELARRNPYAARLVSGLSLSECERLADTSPVGVFVAARRCSDLIAPRNTDQTDWWQRLLGAGVAANAHVREAAQVACLQRILTRPGVGHYRNLRTAACAMQGPALRVSENSDDRAGATRRK